MKRHYAAIAVLSVTLGLSACDDSSTELSSDDSSTTTNAAARGSDNIVTTAAVNGFSTLEAALQVTGLDEVLANNDNQFTVFAPTNAAFDKLGQDTVNALLNDPEQLSDILLYHVIADTVVTSEAALQFDGQSVTSANGDNFRITVDGSSLLVNDATVIQTNVGASNGIIHAIDTVLIPPADPTEGPDNNIVEVAQAADSFNTLVAALQATGLDQVLTQDGPFTVFAPTDEAFAALGQETINALLADTDTLKDILLYHVIAGQAVGSQTALSLSGESVDMANGDTTELSVDRDRLFINQSEVISVDIGANNGVIHVIDRVLLPPSDDHASAPGTLVDVARENGFNTLLAALAQADLLSVLDNPDQQFTVFAPTDRAFAALGDQAIAHLLADQERLSNTLLYHVVAGSVLDSDSVAGLLGQQVHAANGSALRFSQGSSAILVEDASLITVDVPASNGIIHVIDSVLTPPAH